MVANEVGLAKQSAQATEQIAGQIEEMQRNTGTAVSAITAITAIIEQVSSIAGTIAAVEGAVDHDQRDCQERGGSLDGDDGDWPRTCRKRPEAPARSQRTSGWAAAAQQTAAGSTQTNASAKELAKMAARLKEVVSQFKV